LTFVLFHDILGEEEKTKTTQKKETKVDVNFAKRCKSYVKSQLENRNILISYLRKENGEPYGAVVALREEGEPLKIGYSLCHSRKDHFNKFVGAYIAAQRAKTHGIYTGEKLPANASGACTSLSQVRGDVGAAYGKIMERAQKYWGCAADVE
jgi:hypothetical protein